MKRENVLVNKKEIEYEEEFARQERIKEEEQKRKQKELEPLKLYYNARAQVLNYLYYKRRGLVSFIKRTDGINIIEELSDSDYGKVTVENIYENRTLCTITFNKKLWEDGVIKLLENGRR